jgi:hypothetical protein
MRVTGAVVTGEGQRKVRHEMKLCYLVSIPDVDGECYIVKKNFRVDVSPEVPFESEDARPVARAPRPDLEGVDRAALNNIVSNVRVGPGLDETIAKLRAEGVEADDDNEPLEEGAADPPAPPDVQHTFSVPTHCPRRTLNLTDDRGKWAHHRWDEIAEYTEMKLFRMAFPEEWIETVLIPTTNGHLTNRMTLGEFYKWLGCNFFMDRKVDGSWKTFKYTEPFSRYSRAKHWVDDVNNRRHDPIGLEEVWGTKWWAMRQFTFLCSVAEVNAVQSRARGRNEVTAPQLDFRRKLAQQMMENTIDEPVVPQLPAMRTRRPRSSEHKCLKRKRGEGMWDFSYRRFKRVASDYVRLRCHGCRKKIRTYCSCDPTTPLCSGCHALHVNEVE